MEFTPSETKDYTKESSQGTLSDEINHDPSAATRTLTHTVTKGQPVDMAKDEPITTLDLSSTGLKKIASGKVREIFEIDNSILLFVATDRISAFDIVLSNGIPDKGALLTQLSKFWFSLISSKLPHLRTHLVSTSIPHSIPSDLRPVLERRSMQVRRYKILPLESIVRGYITGTAWKEYQRHGTVHGILMPKGLKECERLEKPVWTPSTKAEQGEHDENISPEKAAEIVGKEVAAKVEMASLEIYSMVGLFFVHPSGSSPVGVWFVDRG